MTRDLVLMVIFSITWMTHMVSSQDEQYDYVLTDHYQDLENLSSFASCQVVVVKSSTPNAEREIVYNQFSGRQYQDVYATLFSYIICRHAYLTPGKPLQTPHFSESPKYITFEDTTISLLPVGVFATFTELSELYLNNTAIEDIHPGAFTGLTKLKELYLENNRILELSKGIFNSLPNLEILNVSNNSIEIIEKNAFLGLFLLQHLYINNNKLKEMMPDMFHKLRNLQSLNLSHNSLFNISWEISGSVTNLDLSYNNITNINFSLLPFNLQFLNLCSNNINSIEEMPHFPYINQLDLSNNQIFNIKTVPATLLYLNVSGNKVQELNNSLFGQSQHMLTLDLSHNLLEYLKTDIFENLSFLTSLYLQNNSLINLPIGCFSDLKQLTELNLSGNQIFEFEFGTFSGLSNVENLDISNNELAYLYESTFHPLKNLRVLNMASNRITSFDVHDLLDHSIHLSVINLNNNPWICRSLSRMFNILNKFNVTILRGTEKHKTSIHDNGCLNHIDGSYFDTKETNVSKVQFQTSISNKLNSITKFFDQDFPNSSFYKYFESFKGFNSTIYFNGSSFSKFFDNDFKNTTFYKYFNGSSLERVENAFLNLSKAMRSLETNFNNANLINSGAINKSLATLIEDNFKNSSFYNFFTKEVTNLTFLVPLNKTLQAGTDLSLLKIRDYFDNDFKKSTFYQFFNNIDTNSFQSNFLNNSHAHFAAYADVKTEDTLLSKISELSSNIKVQKDEMETEKVGSVTFLTLIVIILLSIALLLVYKNIQNRFNRNISSNSESRIPMAEAEMELM